jgi:GH18 family chitinase
MKLDFTTSVILLSLSALGAASYIVPSERNSETGEGSSNKVAAAWFAGYHENEFSPAMVPWEKYTHVYYAFA